MDLLNKYNIIVIILGEEFVERPIWMFVILF